MPRENTHDKARRLLTEGRLEVERRDGAVIVASCRGDSGEQYRLGHDPARAPHWRCTCPARTACSHLKALWLVTTVKGAA